ncbi:MAG: ribonuclease J [Ruminococcus sp.]|nr:ribonuclease J [Ruminococcus sp.]
MILDKTEKQITVNNKASRTKSKGNGNSVKKKNSKRTNMSAKTSAAKKPAAKKPAQKSKRSSKYKTAPKKPVPSIKVSFLGGLNEIGKNITLFECMGDMIIIDCGMAFPDGDMLGVDLVIPDFSYIEQNADKIKGLVLTHGHEDHIGGLPYLLSNVNIPIYGTPLTLGLVGNKLKEHNLFNSAKLNTVNAGDRIRLGCMEIEFIHVNHSIPDAVAVAIHSPAGTIVHTGDFKIDCTPFMGEPIDLASFARLGNEGVLALLCESTNASRPGYTPTEKNISDSFKSIFDKAENNRIIIATFASNVNRVQQIIDCAYKHNRKVAFSGRSMVNYMEVAKQLGYLHIPENLLIDIDMLDKYPPEQIVLVTTGSQGEPMSALSRMAYSDHRKVMVGDGDVIVISANPIPGNEKTVGNVVDELLKKGCKVVYESMYEVHVSGHACQEELKIMQTLVKPKYFIPVHGEQKHLRKNAELAMFMGMDRHNIFIGDVGSTVEINRDYMKEIAPVQAGKVFVDGLGVGDVGSIVLRDRKHLGQDGLIIIVASLDVYDGHVISGPDIVSRGFVYVRESDMLLDEVRKLALGILDECADNNIHEWGIIKNRIKDEVSKLITQRTRRTPMILPILMEV